MDFVFGFALNCCGGGEIGHRLVRGYEFRPAVGVAAVVGCVYTYENIKCSEDFCPGQCIAEENRVTGRNISNRDIVSGIQLRAFFWDFNRVVGQGGGTKGGEAYVDDSVFEDVHSFCHFLGGVEFYSVSLAVAEGQGAAVETFTACDCERGGGIEAAAEKYNRFFILAGHGIKAL